MNKEGKGFKIVFLVVFVVGVLFLASQTILKETPPVQNNKGQELEQGVGHEPMSALDARKYDIEGSKGDGKPVILLFGASWCPPCSVMRPDVEAMFEKYSDQVTMRYIDVDKADKDFLYQYPLEVVPTQYFYDVDKKPLQEEDYMDGDNRWIFRADTPDPHTQKHILTGFQGLMTGEELETVIKSMGVKEVD